MGGIRKKKFQSGEGSQYWTRATALRKLQLSLKDFRRLCILKGIYPREPRNRKKAQKGSTGIKILYNKKDIQFLMQEPIIWKFREKKILGRKIGRAKALNDYRLAQKLIDNPVHIHLDHIIKERYPTFIDALRDLDDCLTLCTLFSTFPSLRNVPRDQMNLCRRLMLEFMHVVIALKALRKVFVSIKGYYFQVEIKGQLITWIMPHHFAFQPQSKEEVDFRIMSTFVQLYIVLLGFVNFRLYHQLNLYYPPKISFFEGKDNESVEQNVLESERIAALNISLLQKNSQDQNDNTELDSFNMEIYDKSIVEEANKINRLKNLFYGTKIFLNREVPREPLVFTLRCFGAEVSWDRTLFVGATFDETDETITHQIVDRPSIDKQYLSRYYIQPQWVFDSVNARELMPVAKYFVGCILPPHLSPFVEDETVEYYRTSNFKELKNPEDSSHPNEVDYNKTEKKEQIIEDEYDSDEEEERLVSSGNQSEGETERVAIKEQKRKEMKKKMLVSAGQVFCENSADVKNEKLQEFKLREKMVEKKYRALYRSMREGQALRRRDKIVLKKKRELLEKKRASNQIST